MCEGLATSATMRGLARVTVLQRRGGFPHKSAISLCGVLFPVLQTFRVFGGGFERTPSNAVIKPAAPCGTRLSLLACYGVALL